MSLPTLIEFERHRVHTSCPPSIDLVTTQVHSFIIACSLCLGLAIALSLFRLVHTPKPLLIILFQTMSRDVLIRFSHFAELQVVHPPTKAQVLGYLVIPHTHTNDAHVARFPQHHSLECRLTPNNRDNTLSVILTKREIKRQHLENEIVNDSRSLDKRRRCGGEF